MPRYLVSDHAMERLQERFPQLWSALPVDDLAARMCVARWVSRGKSMGSQRRQDLLLACPIPWAGSTVTVVCAVSPLLGNRRPDTWAVRTVLSLEMAQANSARAQHEIRHAGQRRRQQQRRRRALRLRPQVVDWNC
ncbi:MAG: hypothetical protein EA402_11780 [Planctomycetota bacterium]|nr:MAG: hypothetical protein EA402_11780 [Planctomycetota bacterium]